MRILVVVGGYACVRHLEAFAMHVVGDHRTGRTDEQNGVYDRLERLPGAGRGSFQFGKLVNLTIHGLMMSIGSISQERDGNTYDSLSVKLK